MLGIPMPLACTESEISEWPVAYEISDSVQAISEFEYNCGGGTDHLEMMSSKHNNQITTDSVKVHTILFCKYKGIIINP